MGPETLKLLTVDCSWSLDRYKGWLYATLCQQLLVAGTCVGPTGEWSQPGGV